MTGRAAITTVPTVPEVPVYTENSGKQSEKGMTFPRLLMDDMIIYVESPKQSANSKT